MAAPPPAPLAAPPALALPTAGIMYDIHCPKHGGVAINIPAGHVHADHGNGYYYRRLAKRLTALGYRNVEYSAWSQQTTSDLAIADAIALQTHADLTWMAVPGVMRRMHIVAYSHQGSLY